jgi:pyruvate dehydrogenase E1 component
MSSPRRRFIVPPPDSPEMKYLLERRKALGGFLPARKVKPVALDVPKLDYFAEFFKGSATEVSTTTAFVTLLLRRCCGNKGIGRHIVPIIPDEARTFGLDALFRNRHLFVQRPALRAGGQQIAALLSRGQGRADSGGRHHRGRFDGVVHRRGHELRHARRADDSVLHLLLDVRPQRVGDLFWLAGDIRAKGFLLGATAGRTTLNGEGLATSGRPQPAARQHHPDLPALRPGVRF